MKNKKINEEKAIFSEIYYHSSKKWAKNFMWYKYMSIILSIKGFGIFAIIIVSLWLVGKCYLSIECIYISVAFLSIVIIAVLLYYWIFLYTSWIKITPQHLLLVIGDGRKIMKAIPNYSIRKIVLNMHRKRVEIHLKNGKVLELIREKGEIKNYFLTYDQKKRFEEAMKMINVPYEIVWP